MNTMLKNWWTTILGALAGASAYLNTSGAKFPETKAEWLNLGFGLFLAMMGVAAKDATTGSKPPSA